jgi:transglutaminase-like putative cysteine protease
MRYSVRHVTRFTYDTPITESVMEARMQPRSDGCPRCLHFTLTPSPSARVMMYQDHDGNTVHFFDIPVRHARLTLTAEALSNARRRRRCPTVWVWTHGTISIPRGIRASAGSI